MNIKTLKNIRYEDGILPAGTFGFLRRSCVIQCQWDAEGHNWEQTHSQYTMEVKDNDNQYLLIIPPFSESDLWERI